MEKTANTPAWMKVSEIEIAYKSKVRACDRPVIKKSSDAYDLFLNTWNLDHIELIEEFKVMLLNRANKVLGILPLSVGGIVGTVADPRIIFGTALKAAAVSIILVHAHPSGNTKPSRADEELTERLVQAGKFLDIKVLDHLIITQTDYLSMADEGLI